MKKKIGCSIILISIISTFYIAGAFAGDDDAVWLEPTVDIDFVVLTQSSSTTVTADLGFASDFEIVPILLFGGGNFSASLSRTNTLGETVWMTLIDGAGLDAEDFNAGITPVTIRVSAAVGDEIALVILVHGILVSAETPPLEYSVNLTF